MKQFLFFTALLFGLLFTAEAKAPAPPPEDSIAQTTFVLPTISAPAELGLMEVPAFQEDLAMGCPPQHKTICPALQLRPSGDRLVCYDKLKYIANISTKARIRCRILRA